MEPANDAFKANCFGREVFDHLTGRWGILVLIGLLDGPLRFARLRDRVDGVSEKMLAQTLRTLVRDGLVERTVRPTVPPQVSYTLTELGQEAARPLCDLVRWIGRRAPDIMEAQRRHDSATPR